MSEPVLKPVALALLAGSVLVVGLAGCGSEPAPVAWQVGFADASLRAQAVRIEASIHPGGCDATDVVYRADLRPDVPAPTPPTLDPGRYGFAAMARNAQCRTIARGCVEQELPSRDPVALVLEAVSETAACSPDACLDGYCEGETPPPDGGVVTPPTHDASVPPPPMDAGSGLDAGSPPDAGVAMDAGVPMDAGASMDAGVPDDGGSVQDAGDSDGAAGSDAATCHGQSSNCGN